MAIGAWAWFGELPCAHRCAAGDRERGERAEEGDQRRQRDRDRAGGPCRVHVSVPFGWVRLMASDGRRSRVAGENEADGFDRLGEEREPVDRFRLGVENGEAGRDHERVARDQAGEDSRRRDERELSRPAGQDDRKDGEEDRRGDEAEAGAGAFLEVSRTSAPWMPALIAQARMTRSVRSAASFTSTITVLSVSLCGARTNAVGKSLTQLRATFAPPLSFECESVGAAAASVLTSDREARSLVAGRGCARGVRPRALSTQMSKGRSEPSRARGAPGGGTR